MFLVFFIKFGGLFFLSVIFFDRMTAASLTAVILLFLGLFVDKRWGRCILFPLVWLGCSGMFCACESIGIISLTDPMRFSINRELYDCSDKELAGKLDDKTELDGKLDDKELDGKL